MSATAASVATPAGPKAETDRLPPAQMLAASCGGIHEAMSANVVKMLGNPIFNIGLGVSPTLVGLAMALPRLFAAFADPFIGHLSDRTLSRFGRRRPHMFGGAVFSGFFFGAMWWLPRGMSEGFYFWYFLLASCLFYTAAAFFVIPWEALLIELTHSYHERTKLQAWRSIIGTFGALMMPWLYAATQLGIFADPIEGVRYVGMVVGVVLAGAGLVPVFFLREPPATKADIAGEHVPLHRGFREATRNRPFMFIVLATVLYGPGFMTTEGLGLYVNIYYVYGGDTSAAAIMQGYCGTIMFASKFIWVPVMTWVAGKIGKRRALMLCLGISAFADLMKWFCYTPEHPSLQLLAAAVQSPGMSAAWMLMFSMIGDTVDHDEAETGHRRAGLFLALSQWMRWSGLTLAFLIAGVILSSTGFEAARGAAQDPSTLFQMRIYVALVPALFTLAALWMTWLYPITEERANAARLIIEARRRAKSGTTGN